MTELSAVIQGSAIVNGIFALLWGIGKFLSKRLEDSKCSSSNFCFTCESNLKHLKTIRETNEVQLEHLKDLMDQMKVLKKESNSIITLN